MPVTAIASYFFNQIDGGEAGWSENWYVTAATIEDCLTRANLYATPRRAILHQNWYLEAVRVSDLTVLRDSKETNYDTTTGAGTFRAGTAAPASQGILLRMEAGATRRRMFFLRGIPTGQVNQGNALTMTPAFTNAMNAFVAWWTANQGVLLIQKKLRGTDVGVVVQPGAVEPRSINITYPALAPPPPVGSYINIFNVPQNVAYGFNGIWIADIVAALAVSTKPKRKHFSFGAPFGARAATITFSYENVTSAAPERGGNRKTGRPFDSPHGRLSATRH